MIVIAEPVDMVVRSRPCHCGGACPYGLAGRCPASTASMSIAYGPRRHLVVPACDCARCRELRGDSPFKPLTKRTVITPAGLSLRAEDI